MHPDRREATSMRILVRAGELRCRNDWGSDLWQLREPGDQVLEVAMLDDRSKPREEGTAARRIPPPVDRVIQPAADQRAAEPERHHLVSDDLNRELLRKAREQFRDRQSRPSYWSAAQSEPESEPIVISNEVIPPTAPTSQRAIRTDDDIALTLAETDQSRSGLPEVFDPRTANETVEFAHPIESEPVYQVDDPWKLASTTQEAPAWDSPSTRPFAFDADANRGQERTPKVPLRRTSSAAKRSTRSGSGVDEVDQGYRSSRTVRDADHRIDRPEEPFAADAADRDHADAHDPLAEVIAESWQEPDDSGLTQSPRWNAEAESVDWDEQDDRLLVETDRFAVAADVEPETVWAHLPKCCGTCKDFRPAADGKRGWCNNQFAFKHRRMVEADDRPCETSLGHWWVAADFAWQGEVEMEAYTQPTPLMDKWFGRIDTDVADAPAARRRRQS